MVGDKSKTKRAVRVELHVHLDGSLRHETIWEVLKAKKLPLPGNGSFRDLRNALLIRDPIDLAHFLKPIQIFLPALIDDFEVMERIAYEFIEDKAQEQVAYVEVRFAPHILLSESKRDIPHLSEAIKAVHKGLSRASSELGVDFRIILVTILGQNTEEEVLKLCEMHKDIGVVAIDKAGVLKNKDEVPLDGILPQVFQKAAKLGIHRTVHAGESGTAEMVGRAVNLYEAERIGHGYHVIDDPKVYSDCLQKGVHFECCPWSSLLTGAVPFNQIHHPIVQFADDSANFSISTDDSTMTGYNVPDNLLKIQSWGLTEVDAVRVSVNAARSSFLPESDQQQLIKKIHDSMFAFGK